jgi:hypothetical protein
MSVPGKDRRIRRLFGFGVWCFIVVGSAHLLIMAPSAARGASAERQHAQDAMRAVPITMLGLTRNLDQLFTGANAAMGLLAVGIGVLSLVGVRQAPELLTGRRAVIWGAQHLRPLRPLRPPGQGHRRGTAPVPIRPCSAG